MDDDIIKTVDQYLIKYEFLDYCKTCLINMIEVADSKHLSSERIHFCNDNDRKKFARICNIDDIDNTKWLLDNGHKNDLYMFYYKHLFFTLIVDFSNYYIASIEQAYNGNIYVAWSLLRKPLQETLAYFEWLYVDKDELLSLMLEQDDPKKYEIMSKALKDKREKHIKHIQGDKEASVIDMFSFRYSYEAEFSINGILQATNHLITSRPALRTSSSGLNFVFKDDEMIKRDIGFYFNSLPYIMQYTMNILFDLFFDIAKFSEYTCVINKTNLFLKNMKALEIAFSETKKILSIDLPPIICSKCGRKHSQDINWIQFADGMLECNNCSNKTSTNGLILDYEQETDNNQK